MISILYISRMATKKKKTFEDFYNFIMENMTVDSAGVGATNTTAFSGDTYAPGDARVPKLLGLGSKKCGKKKSKNKVAMIRRNMPVGM